MEIITTITTFILIPLALVGYVVYMIGKLIIEAALERSFEHEHEPDRKELDGYLQVVDNLNERICCFKRSFIQVGDNIIAYVGFLKGSDTEFKYIGVGVDKDIALEDKSGNVVWLDGEFLHEKSKHQRKDSDNNYVIDRCTSIRKKLDDGTYMSFYNWRKPFDEQVEELMKKANDILKSDAVQKNVYYYDGIREIKNTSTLLYFSDDAECIEIATEDEQIQFNSPAEAAAYAESTNVNKL